MADGQYTTHIPYPRPSDDRLNRARRELFDVEQYILPGSAVLVTLLVRALIARGCTTAEAMWAIDDEICRGNCEAYTLETLPPGYSCIVGEQNPPAGLKVADGVVHVDSSNDSPWGVLTIILPDRTTYGNEDPHAAFRFASERLELSVESVRSIAEGQPLDSSLALLWTLDFDEQRQNSLLTSALEQLALVSSGIIAWDEGRGLSGFIGSDAAFPHRWRSAHEAAIEIRLLAVDRFFSPLEIVERECPIFGDLSAEQQARFRKLLDEHRRKALAMSLAEVADLQIRIRDERAKFLQRPEEAGKTFERPPVDEARRPGEIVSDTTESKKAKPSTQLDDSESEDQTTVRVLSVYTNGLTDDRFSEVVAVLRNKNLTANDKLTKIDRLLPFPFTTSSRALGKLLRVSHVAIQHCAWWQENRRGETENEIGRRRDKHRQREEQIELKRTKDDDD